MPPARPRLGVSTCLLGESVRYDGQHKRNRFLTGALGPHVEWVPVCPEFEAGLGVPREAMRLVGDPEAPRLITINTGRDLTERMSRWSRQRVDALGAEALCGYVFKKDSPSSGLSRVKVYDANNVPRRVGVGLFAREFVSRFPLLPVEDEGRLNDAGLRAHFLEAVFTVHRWRQMCERHPAAAGLVEFHADHKYLIMSHSAKHLRVLGRLVAGAGRSDLTEVREAYFSTLMAAYRYRATRRKNANVLEHTLGYFKKQLSADEKQEALETIRSYKGETVPLVVPIMLFRHYIRKYGEPYLGRQVYFEPFPDVLKLRNAV
jgi:uncharacterized protein YbgA (DUF1722 family)/uncharacterized protein YbbK (DUF523 family)